MIIKVENTKKLNLSIMLIAISTAIITWIVEIISELPEIIILWPILFGIGLIGAIRFDYSEFVFVVFEDNKIILTRKNKSVFIIHDNIKEVQRITNYGKLGSNEGYHQVKLATKQRNYTFYTNIDEQRNNTPFEATELGHFYYKLKKYGIKCC